MLLGFDLMRNFRHPYFVANITDFWQRWHISLSSWLRDYLYISLGGNRKGQRRTYINLLATMLLSGLWHGANWNFVFWGFLHGLYLSIHKAFRALVPQRTEPVSAFLKIRNGISIAVTFVLVTFTWLFFRATDLATIQAYLTGLSKFNFDGELGLVPLFFLAALVLLIDISQALTQDEFCFLRLPVLPRAVTASAALLLLIFSVGGQHEPFIYFQF